MEADDVARTCLEYRLARGVTSSRETMQVGNATIGRLLNSYLVPSSADEACGTFPLAWLPNGAWIAWGGADTVVHLWSLPACLR
jgi:hypothetical protein